MGDRARAVEYYKAAEQAVSSNATQAFNNFVAAAFVDPTWGQAHFQCGNNLHDLQKPYSAVAAYRRSLECDLDDETKAKVLSNLGYMLQVIGQLDEALEILLQAADLDPKLMQTWVSLSIVHYLLNNTETSVSCALKAYESDTDNCEYEACLAFAYMQNRQFKEGLHHFEARFRWKLQQFLRFPFTRWRGEKNKIIFVCADQGLGDTLSFARFIPHAAKMANHLYLGVQPPLMRTFEWAFMKYDNITIQPLGQNLPGYDHWTTFVSLPAAMGLSEEEIVTAPHINPGIGAGRKDWKVPNRKLHVGIAWAGSNLNPINNHRSIPLTHFLDLQKVPGIQLYGLQADERKQDLIDWGTSAVIRDLSGYIADVSDTAAIMKNLDLVISCESACAHIAALAGVECWVPYSRLGKDFRIGIDGSKAIWTPKHRFFLQTEETWTQTFERIAEALGQKIALLDEQRGTVSSRKLEKASA